LSSEAHPPHSRLIVYIENKPNGQFHLPSEREAITAFMRDLSIRKIPGIGRVNERMLDSIGIKVSSHPWFLFKSTL
jgi:DNA polymerase kappa